MADSIVDIALLVTRALDACGVAYSIGGSVASSFSGEPRFTQDVDILVDLAAPQIDPLLAQLGAAFYADADAIRRAVARRSSVNLIHMATSIKIDFFVAGASPLDAPQLRRRQHRQVASNPDAFAYFHSHEDILLQKLLWYRSGGEVSERQWRDVQAIVLKQGGRLDLAYLRDVGSQAGVLDLLDRALALREE
ncbi:MAG: hypothetical protein HQ485_11740 [Acidobacteria bacterium]|nr:hypothetical protein [Acidobacteriota bacterium]